MLIIILICVLSFVSEYSSFKFFKPTNIYGNIKSEVEKSQRIHHFSLNVRKLRQSKFPLIDGINERNITKEMIEISNENGMIRKEEIKQAMKNVWESYKKYAWGYDELKPLSKQGNVRFHFPFILFHFLSTTLIYVCLVFTVYISHSRIIIS